MKILYLSPHRQLIEFLERGGDEVVQYLEPLADKHEDEKTHKIYYTLRPEAIELLKDIDFIISYGYRSIICPEITDRFKGRAVNLHISYLPYNRGADPNLWSFLEDTPIGVTIHCLDGNIDTGDVIVREKVEFDLETDTLRTTYRRLSETIEALFCRVWPEIRAGKVNPLPQLTYHRARDKDKYHDLLTRGWDTPIKDILGKAK